jgi:hypothetical protein
MRHGPLGSRSIPQTHESVPAGTLIGTSPQWRAVLKRASQAASTEATTWSGGSQITPFSWRRVLRPKANPD